MFSRQRALLRLIENEGGRISKLRLVKLAFLLSRNGQVPRTGVYDFVPYKRGPFSFTLYHDLRTLERDGWLAETSHDLELREAPCIETATIEEGFLGIIDSTSRCQHAVATSIMVDRVYRDYPWFTLNSEIIEKRAAVRPSAKPKVYTVGYEGIMVDALLDILLRSGVKKLIDVRNNPIARRYGFHKSTLSKLCNDIEIEYLHLAALGVPSSWRTDLSDPSSYEALFNRYECEILPSNRSAVEAVAEMVADSPAALMCMEADHKCCHRSRLGAEVSRLTGLPMMELRGA